MDVACFSESLKFNSRNLSTVQNFIISKPDQLKNVCKKLNNANEPLDIDVHFDGLLFSCVDFNLLLSVINENHHRICNFEIWDTQIGEHEAKALLHHVDNLVELKLCKCYLTKEVFGTLHDASQHHSTSSKPLDVKKSETNSYGSKTESLCNSETLSLIYSETSSDSINVTQQMIKRSKQAENNVARRCSSTGNVLQFYVENRNQVTEACGQLDRKRSKQDVIVVYFGLCISDCGLKKLLRAVAHNRHKLKRLIIYDSDLDKSEAKSIGKLIGSLEELTVNGCEITEDFFRTLSKSIRDLKSTLKVLDLSYSVVEDCQTIASCLHKIDTLYLNDSKLPSASAQAIRSSLDRKILQCRVLGLDCTCPTEANKSFCPEKTSLRSAVAETGSLSVKTWRSQDCAISDKREHSASDVTEVHGAGSTSRSCHVASDESCTSILNSETEKTSSVVGSAGGTLNVGNCHVIIPKGALDDNVTITLTSYYDRNPKLNRATPLLRCEPHGLKFKKDVDVILPTCYVTDSQTSVKAKVRHSVDGIHWKIIKQICYRMERRFKFRIRGFSWYDVIMDMLFNMTVEKLVVCCIPRVYDVDPRKLVVVCDISDSVLSHSKSQDHTQVFQRSLALRNSENDVSIELRSNCMNISPNERFVDDIRRSYKSQVQFLLERWDETMLFRPVTIKMTTERAATSDEFYIPNCQSGTVGSVSDSGETPSTSGQQPKVTGETVNAAVAGCDKVTYIRNDFHIHDPETGRQVALQRLENNHQSCVTNGEAPS